MSDFNNFIARMRETVYPKEMAENINKNAKSKRENYDKTKKSKKENNSSKKEKE